VEDLQVRENRWMIADLCGKGAGCARLTVSLWAEQGINAWQAAGKV
jgi:hypothetical protein